MSRCARSASSMPPTAGSWRPPRRPARAAPSMPAQLDAVLAKSGGIPFYLEELVKAAASGFDLSMGPQGGPAGAVPSTIDDALMAQLDQLGLAKQVAQHASVIGPEFQLGLLAKVMARSPDELSGLLDDLVGSRIVVRGSASPDAYRFKHSLIHDISYRSLLRKNRRQIHLAGGPGTVRPAAVYRRGEQRPDRPAPFAGRGASRGDQVLAARRPQGDRPIGQRRGHRNAAIRPRRPEESARAGAARAGTRPGPDPGHGVALGARLLGARGGAGGAPGRGRCAPSAAMSVPEFSVEWGLFQCTIVKGDIEAPRRSPPICSSMAGTEPGEAMVDAYLAKGMAAFNAGEFEASVNVLRSRPPASPGRKPTAALPDPWPECRPVLPFLSGARAMLSRLCRPGAGDDRAGAGDRGACARRIPGTSTAPSTSRSTRSASITCAAISPWRGGWPTRL